MLRIDEEGPRIPSWTLPCETSVGKEAGRLTLKQSLHENLSSFTESVCLLGPWGQLKEAPTPGHTLDFRAVCPWHPQGLPEKGLAAPVGKVGRGGVWQGREEGRRVEGPDFPRAAAVSEEMEAGGKTSGPNF